MAIDPEVYFDNDADIEVTGIGNGRTVLWHLATASNSNTAVNAAVSGSMTESPAGTYKATLQGDAITTHLTPDTTYYLVIRVGQDLRVFGQTTCREVRLANV
jgi:hypothetical protein